jgi:hypothetical protein
VLKGSETLLEKIEPATKDRETPTNFHPEAVTIMSDTPMLGITNVDPDPQSGVQSSTGCLQNDVIDSDCFRFAFYSTHKKKDP